MKKIFLSLMLALLGALPTLAQGDGALYKGFLNPDNAARPRVWWHWMNGNITKDGISKDLHWMKRSGIVGFHNFDAGLETPQVVEHRIPYMTAEWKDAFRYMLGVADSLGMEVTIASSPGWSETGGPWVKDENGMKKLVWREVDVQGGKKLRLKLPEGFDATGQFLDYGSISDKISDSFLDKKFYRDVAVLAVNVSDNDIPMSEFKPKATSSNGEISVERLANDRISDFAVITPDAEGKMWIQLEFPKPFTAKSVQVMGADKDGEFRGSFSYELQSSDDGVNFKKVAGIGYQANAVKTDNIPATTARFFRLCISGSTKKAFISMFELSPVNRVQRFGDKGGFSHYRYAASDYTKSSTDAIPLGNVVDVTQFVKDGVLTWNAPKGRWRIMRFGYSLTGKTNHPASPEATGLEVDKFDTAAIHAYYKDYLSTYVDASNGMMGKRGIQYLLQDSYEAGPQTWTAKMQEEFKNRRGYDLLPWLPALTGIIINSSEETDRFLFDWRHTLGDMLSEYNYDNVNDILRPYGLKRYTESHEAWRANMSDGMDCKRYADIPMSAIWMRYKQKHISEPQFEGDIRESASVAHIYGQNIAAAESFTANGYRDGALVYSPSVLKPTADAAMACGLNRFVVHTSPHQPVDNLKPGLSLGIYGQWFDRHESWANQAWSWTDYLSRSCYMLQQGRFVADAAVFYGEDTNVTGVYQTKFPREIPGYAFDFVSPSVIKEVFKVDNGQLTTATGMRYNVLYLTNVARMSIPVLRKIKEFADAGVNICGEKPKGLASREGTVEEFNALVNDIWGSGRANVHEGVMPEKVLANIGVSRDVDFMGSKATLRFVHRHVSNGEIYWIANQTDARQTLNVSFRVVGKKPQIWHAENGNREDASYEVKDGRTIVSLDFGPYDAQFIVFVNDTNSESWQKPSITSTTVAEVAAPWTVNFQEKRGAPATAEMSKLVSLTESNDPGVKYFSGEATYKNTFTLDKKLFRKKNMPQRIVLDLGEVHDLAEVSVNGTPLGVVWHTPFTLDVTGCVHAGENQLEVKVVNVWHNRLVGDDQPGAQRVGWTQVDYFTPDEPLLPAGLLGPVKVSAEY